MFKYKLKIIPGTKEFVLKELSTKFPDSKVFKDRSEIAITFESEVSDIDVFRQLYSPLYVVLIVESLEGRLSKVERNLFRKEWRKDFVPAGINPSLAYIMCQMAEINDQDIVLDPFCGGGTLPITASLYFGAKKVLASDISGNAVDITIQNIKHAHLNKNKYVVFRSDVSKLKLQKDYINKVVTNLPFGIRTGDHESNLRIYSTFAKYMNTILKIDSHLVILTQEKELVRSVFNKVKFTLLNEYDVNQGGLIPTIFIFKKKQ